MKKVCLQSSIFFCAAGLEGHRCPSEEANAQNNHHDDYCNEDSGSNSDTNDSGHW